MIRQTFPCQTYTNLVSQLYRGVYHKNDGMYHSALATKDQAFDVITDL